MTARPGARPAMTTTTLTGRLPAALPPRRDRCYVAPEMPGHLCPTRAQPALTPVEPS